MKPPPAAGRGGVPPPPATTIFGYTFARPELLAEALTTPSVKIDRPRMRDNQRLEFLGDAVLGLLAGEYLYANHPREEEGRLTICRSQMVSSDALSEAAVRLGLRERLRQNRGAAPIPDGSKTLADAVEALVGAVYIDGGLAAARQVFAALDLTANAARPEAALNPKGELQIRAQALRPQRKPVYTLVKQEGKAHKPIFTIKVALEGIGEATASAGNRKGAEMLAAAKLLKRMDGEVEG